MLQGGLGSTTTRLALAEGACSVMEEDGSSLLDAAALVWSGLKLSGTLSTNCYNSLEDPASWQALSMPGAGGVPNRVDPRSPYI